MAANSLELACNLIQAKIATNLQPAYVSQVPLTMERYFTALSDELCPYVQTWPTEGQFYQKGGAYKVIEATCTIFCFVESLQQKDIPTRTLQGTRIMQAMLDLFATASTIPLSSIDATGYQITVQSGPDAPQSYSGLKGNFPYSGMPWCGFSIPLSVHIQYIVQAY